MINIFFVAGENASFEFQLSDKANVTWLKDNKPLDDRLADRLTATEKANNVFKLDIKHCSESDSGIYIAKATNGSETSTSSAQLVVHECKLVIKNLRINLNRSESLNVFVSVSR